MPEEWARQVQTWSRLLRARRGDVEGTGPPDRNDEYLFYQLLLGAWPVELTGVVSPDPDKMHGFVERIEVAMTKSLREAKLRSNWTSPDTAYEEAVLQYVRDALDASRPNAFLNAFIPFQERIAQLGIHNSLVQTTLKLTLPGMPDLYQGAELWDLSLVDPDNRRPVDYRLRIEQLEEIALALESSGARALLDMFEEWRDGRVKMAVLASLLAYRRDHSELFAAGGYEPLTATGDKAEHLCAFARSFDRNALLVVVARFPARLEADPDWNETEIPQPSAGHAHWRDLLCGHVVEFRQKAINAGAVLRQLPVAVLVPADRSIGFQETVSLG
jgi:(1->4)-alpha-D-glucan 1-alpha-D-glucosylmutase